MSSKTDDARVDHVDAEIQEKQMHTSEAVLGDSNLMQDAFQAENREHEMTLWEAVTDHPMACFWAFVFCFTIVSTARHLQS